MNWGGFEHFPYQQHTLISQPTFASFSKPKNPSLRKPNKSNSTLIILSKDRLRYLLLSVAHPNIDCWGRGGGQITLVDWRRGMSLDGDLGKCMLVPESSRPFFFLATSCILIISLAVMYIYKFLQQFYKQYMYDGYMLVNVLRFLLSVWAFQFFLYVQSSV